MRMVFWHTHTPSNRCGAINCKIPICTASLSKMRQNVCGIGHFDWISIKFDHFIGHFIVSLPNQTNYLVSSNRRKKYRCNSSIFIRHFFHTSVQQIKLHERPRNTVCFWYSIWAFSLYLTPSLVLIPSSIFNLSASVSFSIPLSTLFHSLPLFCAFFTRSLVYLSTSSKFISSSCRLSVSCSDLISMLAHGFLHVYDDVFAFKCIMWCVSIISLKVLAYFSGNFKCMWERERERDMRGREKVEQFCVYARLRTWATHHQQKRGEKKHTQRK